MSKEWPLWEVFIRSKQGLDHKHVGSLHATDAAMAIENARELGRSNKIPEIAPQSIVKAIYAKKRRPG